MLCATKFQLPDYTASVFRNVYRFFSLQHYSINLRKYIKREELKANISNTNEVLDTEKLYLGP